MTPDAAFLTFEATLALLAFGVNAIQAAEYHPSSG